MGSIKFFFLGAALTALMARSSEVNNRILQATITNATATASPGGQEEARNKTTSTATTTASTADPTTISSSDRLNADRRVVVVDQAMGARCAVAADFDGDGRMDIVSASSNDNAVSWFRNEGPASDGSAMPQFSVKKPITWSSLGSRIVTVADIDGDGDIDVVGASYYDSSLRWFENDGKGAFKSHLISSSVNEGQGVAVADINNDGAPDIISASSGDNTIAVFKQIDKGFFCEIKDVVDDQAIGARTVVASDINGDGWVDLASASKDDDTVAWYPNDGTGHFPTKIVISSGNETKGAYSLVASDVDQDGHMDLVVASNGNDHVSLFRNDKNGTGNFTKTLIFGDADFVLSVTVADFDRDGDLDVASASFFDGHINWYENLDGKGYEWTNHTIYVGMQGHYVSVGDMDGDGDDDLIAVTHAENTVAVYLDKTLCDFHNSSSRQKADCCHQGSQWNGTDCQICPHGTYGTGSGLNAKCIDCPVDACVIPGFTKLPATCSGITGCVDVDASLAQCVCEANAMKDPTTDACIACPDGQVRPDDPNMVRDVASLGNYTIWENEHGVCYVPDEREFITMIVFIVLVGALFLAVISLIWYRHVVKARALALLTIDGNEIQYDDPVVVIGKGAFGEVLKGHYRGTEVAIKRALPVEKRRSVWSSPNSSRTSSNSMGKNNGDEEAGLAKSKNLGLISLASNRSLPNSLASHRSLPNSSNPNPAPKRSEGIRKLRQDFISEISQLAKLRHPNITTMMGAVLTPGESPMLVMEYMHNGSLYDAIRNDSIDLDSRDDILTIVQDVARGMLFLHSANPKVIHGDLKSKNVLIDCNFRAKVTDFGMCSTNDSGVRGTPFWMAPELIMEKGANTAMSDIYAFGILLYEVYARKNPYDEEVDYQKVLRDVCDPSVSKRPPIPVMCPASIASLYESCLEGDPVVRPTAHLVDATLQAEGTLQGRVFRIEALNKELVESNQRTTTQQATQLAHFASMSHEIRTPLNCVLGVSSLLVEDENLGPSQLDLVKMIESSGKLLRHVVDDVLDFSKLISGNFEIDIKRTDLQLTLNTVATSMKLSPITDRKNISIQTFYDPNVPQYVETDERRLQQILYNLLSNAVKFSEEKSTVDLTVSVDDGSNNNGDVDVNKVSLNGSKTCRPKLRIAVKDYGTGIKDSDFEKIFQPFQQTETGSNNTDGGTGLGLAITKQLTELLGGSIAVDSKMGEWTEFLLQFPLTGTNVNTQYLVSRLSKCCIWLVSDNDSAIQYTIEACRYFNIQCFPFQHLSALAGCFAPFGTDSVIVCLVQEDLYDDASYANLSKKVKSILLSFGPDGNIGRSKLHYQSLTEVFPSVLMQQLIDLCDAKAPTKASLMRRPSRRLSTISSLSLSSYEELKVLVAEDNKVNQKVFLRLLERIGVSNVQIVSNGQDAVDLEAKQAFDIIFMDIQMPVMDGMEACKRIMARYPPAASNASNATNIATEGSRQPPQVIFLSANVMDDYEAMCIENGAADYMTKPCTLQDLRQKLAEFFFYAEDD